MKEQLHHDDVEDFSSTSTIESETKRSSSSSDVEEKGLMRKETIAVNRSKLLVYVALLLTAAIVGSLTYVLISREETNNFNRDFSNLVNEVTSNADHNAEQLFGQLQALSITYTAYAVGSNLTFPNVTLPYFDAHAHEVEKLNGMDIIGYAPLIVPSMKQQWEAYSIEHQSWIEQDMKLRGWYDDFNQEPIPETIHAVPEADIEERRLEEAGCVPEMRRLQDGSLLEDMYTPLWQLMPVPQNSSVVNLDLYTQPSFNNMIRGVLANKHTLLSERAGLDYVARYTNVNLLEEGLKTSYIVQPVFDTLEEDANIAGFLFGDVNWRSLFSSILPRGKKGVMVYVEGSCGCEFTYVLDGDQAQYVGKSEAIDPRYVDYGVVYDFATFARRDIKNELGGYSTAYTFTIYPTKELEEPYYTNRPAVFTASVVLVFCFTIFVFVVYDYLVHRRQQKLLRTAQRTTAIVSSLFPKDIQRRILEEAEMQAQNDISERTKSSALGAKRQIKSFLHDGVRDESSRSDGMHLSKPIADLFPAVTIMFADIVGFTAWSSTREPSQVFTLLESIYNEFDKIAKRRRVFKVETVGDCYVAVVGLPEPRKDHATSMSYFARDCMHRFSAVTKNLEVVLGPDTTELGLRIGLHSGPVTAGVLRGDKARFQLFGDTMNTTSRIENTGARNKIHISQDTAELLQDAGKGHWLRQREDKVSAKGKGELTTYWLEVTSASSGSTHSGSESKHDSEQDSEDANKKMEDTVLAADADDMLDAELLCEKKVRLINWVTDILARGLKEIVARHEAQRTVADPDIIVRANEQKILESTGTALDEVADIITLPHYDADAANKQRDASTIELPLVVTEQLRRYITTIAALYRANAFHNFEHASHVTNSVSKLLSRIIAPEVEEDGDLLKDIHDHTYGITSCPLTQFAVLLSAIIHDTDHTGVPNATLVKEDSRLASVYKGKSVAEQNSVDIAWSLLMQDEFQDLRRTIYKTSAELQLFRMLVVNSVMATDIADKELGAARKARWNKAFAENQEAEDQGQVVNRKATIVIEHLIQASDVAHTMQHWHVYRKWNTRFFKECYVAYLEGRAEQNPAESWYKGEIGFFDFYIIPLAKKLKDCGVFGVSSDEYYSYALQNRREWEMKGQQIVEEMVELVTRELALEQDSKPKREGSLLHL